MSGKVYANGRRIIHAGDRQTFVAAAPDVCKTPSPSGPTPVPYPNSARSKDLTGGSRKVTIEGASVAIEGAKLRTSTGDEAGNAGGGVISGKTKGVLTWGSCSLDVRFEGKGVLRFFEPTLHNGNASNSGGSSPGDNYMMPPDDPETECLHCGKTFAEHEFPVLVTDTEPYEAAIDKFRKKQDAHMVGGLRVRGRGKRPSQEFLAHAGKMEGWLNAEAPIYNFCTGEQINLGDRERLERGPGRNPVGNCVEQKTLHQAWLQNERVFPFGLPLRMGVGMNLKGPASTKHSRKQLEKSMREPCKTCREVLMAMLCQNDPKKDSI